MNLSEQLFCGVITKNQKNPICMEDGCSITANYNNEGEKRAIYCVTHKKEGMIDVRSKKCIEDGCNKHPSYNNEGEKRGIYCATHKKEGMIDVKNRTCIEDGCSITANYNNEGEKRSIYCATHKKEGMIDVKNRTCIEDGCNKQANYNNEGEKRAIYCATHKKEGMIDVKNRTCIEDGCNKQANYNNEGEKRAIYCATHKKEGMIDVRSNKCIEDGCNKRANYNNEGEKRAIYCATHKKEGMIDVNGKKCKTYLCYTIVLGRYKGYCLNCYIHVFPDEPVPRNYKTKESAVVDYIKSTFPDLSWITDKTISGGCSKRRPDMFLDLGYQVVIIEVDENQHNGYSCENKRIMQLSQDVGHRPILFIRFNPDRYIRNGSETVTSCWKINKNGICVINKSKQKEWSSRLNKLVENIAFWINPINKINKTIEIVSLFYS